MQNAESSVSAEGDSLSLFPDILRRAAYVSSGGRVYHLFSEEDESTVLNSPLGTTLRIAPIAPAEAEESYRPEIPDTDDDVEKIDDVARLLSEIERLEVGRRISVDEAIRRKRGVEGICGASIRKPTIDIPKTPSTQAPTKQTSSKQTPSGVRLGKPRHDLRFAPFGSAETDRPTLKLAEILPELVPPVRTKDLPEAPPTELEARSETSEPPFFPAPLPEPLEETLPEPLPETLPETLSETLPEPLEETPLEPLPETLKIRPENEQGPKAVPKIPASWRLHWHPVWPEHLDSLEQDASGQIRSLVDHLEGQLKKGCKVISFNGYQPGDGCTTMSLCAARGMAERGHRILLADAHRQTRELLQLLKLDVDPHFYEIMTLVPDRLELLPWSESQIEVDSREEIHSISFADIVASLRDEYDGIILDAGSLIGSPLNEQVARWRQMRSDGVLLVVNPKNPEPVNIPTIAGRLRRFDVELLGVAENYV